MTIIGETLVPDPSRGGQLQRAIFRAVSPQRGPLKKGLWEQRTGAHAHGIEFEIKTRTGKGPDPRDRGRRTEKYIQVRIYESFSFDPSRPPVVLEYQDSLVDFVKEIIELSNAGSDHAEKEEKPSEATAAEPVPDTLDPLAGICSHCDADAVGGAVVPAGTGVPPRDVLFCEEHRQVAVEGVNPLMIFSLLDDDTDNSKTEERTPA